MFRNRAFWLAGSCLAVGLMLGWCLQMARSQPAATADDEEMTLERREKLYEVLLREVGVVEQHGNVLKTVVKLVSPTVVHIEAKKRDVSKTTGRSKSIDEAGSGLVMQYNDKFYILTNRHVIKDAEVANITIGLSDGRQLHPTQVWADPDTDIAIMSISATNLFAAKLGDSNAMEIGDLVLAVGSPFGLSHSITYGIISAKGRRDLQLGDDGVRFQDFMQTDAAINPGNSGGPLINMRGEVIGINTAIASNSGGNEGIGFTIPINMVMIIARQLVERGSVSRAFLGVSLDRKFAPTAAQQLGLPRVQGARVTAITANSPAASTELKIGDVILEFNGVRVQDDNHLVNLVSLTEVGVEVPIVIFRDRKRQTINVKVGDRRKFDPQRSEIVPPKFGPRIDLGMHQVEEWDIGELGLTVANLTPAIAARLRMAENTTGLLVTEVDSRGPAANLLWHGDVIDAIEQFPVRKVEDLDEVLASVESAEGLRVHVVPRNSSHLSSRIVIIRPRQ